MADIGIDTFHDASHENLAAAFAAFAAFAAVDDNGTGHVAADPMAGLCQQQRGAAAHSLLQHGVGGCEELRR